MVGVLLTANVQMYTDTAGVLQDVTKGLLVSTWVGRGSRQNPGSLGSAA